MAAALTCPEPKLFLDHLGIKKKNEILFYPNKEATRYAGAASLS